MTPGEAPRDKAGDGDFVRHGVSVTRQPQTSTLVPRPLDAVLFVRARRSSAPAAVGAIGLQVVAGTRRSRSGQRPGVGAPPPRALLSRGAGRCRTRCIFAALSTQLLRSAGNRAGRRTGSGSTRRARSPHRSSKATHTVFRSRAGAGLAEGNRTADTITPCKARRRTLRQRWSEQIAQLAQPLRQRLQIQLPRIKPGFTCSSAKAWRQGARQPRAANTARSPSFRTRSACS